MKKLIFLVFAIAPFFLRSQITTVLPQKDTSGVDDNRSGTGLIDYYQIAQRTNGTSPIPYPNPAGGVQHAKDSYQRFTADEISKGFGNFDNFVNNAIDHGQSFGFRIVTIDDSYGGNTVGGARMAYPIAWHNTMQGEANPDFLISATNSVWWPNYNSTSYKSNWRAMMVSIAAHINAGVHNGVKYSDVFMYKDIGGIGIYGEGHGYVNSANNTWVYPTGTTPTLASMKEIVQAQADNFPGVPLIGNVNFLNSNSNLPAGFDAYYMTGFNAWGFFGLRWDHACDAGDFNLDYTSKPAATKTWLSTVYQNAPVLAEPQQFNFAVAGQCDYSHVMTEVQTFHASTIENTDSYENGATLPGCTLNLLYSIAKSIGYRYTITQTTTTDSVRANGLFSVTGNFKNIGIAPNYEDYDLFYELRQAGVAKWTGTSNLLFKWFQPGANNHTDNFTLTNLATGVYDLYMIVRSRKKRVPLYMQLTGFAARQTDGSYLLRAGIHSAVNGTVPPPPPPPPPNNPPTVFAGFVQTDTLPKNVDTLQGIVSDPDNDPTTLLWVQTAGPNTATMVSPTALLNRITGLIEGQYTFRLTANDGRGGITSSDANVTVIDTSHAVPPPPPPPPPVYNARTVTIDTAGTTIQLPLDSLLLHAHTTRNLPDTAILSMKWVIVTRSAINLGTIVTSTDSTTRLRGLSAGFYLMKFTVVDKAGNITESFIYVTVLPAILPDPPPPSGIPGPRLYLGIKI